MCASNGDQLGEDRYSVSTAWESGAHPSLENQRDIKEARRDQMEDNTGKGKRGLGDELSSSDTDLFAP